MYVDLKGLPSNGHDPRSEIYRQADKGRGLPVREAEDNKGGRNQGAVEERRFVEHDDSEAGRHQVRRACGDIDATSGEEDRAKIEGSASR